MTNHPSRRRIVHRVDDLRPNHWMARQLPRGTSLRPYAEDRAISTLTAAVQRAIDEVGMSRKDVADLLGTTKSYVSQVLNGSTNMTLKTLGALLWATGRQVHELVTDPLGASVHIGDARDTEDPPVPVLVGTASGGADRDAVYAQADISFTLELRPVRAGHAQYRTVT